MGKSDVIKVVFGGVIFLFATALGYFTASYLSRTQSFDYDNALLLFGGAYILLGIVVARIFPVSLGFLLGADVFLLHVLSKEYSRYDSFLKTAITGVVLVVLYVFAWMKLGDRAAQPQSQPPA